MSVLYPFPPINSMKREKEFYESVLGWKRSELDLENPKKTINCAGFEDGTLETDMLVKYLESRGYTEPCEILNSLEENLNPKGIADERLYILNNFKRISGRNLSSRYTQILIKFIENDNEIEIYEINGRRYVLGMHIPRVLELAKKIKGKDRRIKHRYPLIEEGVECTTADELARVIGVSIQTFRKMLHENEELRSNIYIRNTGRMVVKKEDEEKLKESFHAILPEA